ncbi:calcium/sodium antiporter [Planctomicrobium sp. SH527]|uniref:calcium/sodium antiporter n=1 Tax=Planctomicrobium sp. SH527 TaxID=3448123 RepID=UPI003F5B5691
MTEVLSFLAGLAILVIGAEFTVRGASRLATAMRISPMVIGLTIVSVGTSTPELAVGITASQMGNGGLAVGNIAGTNILNLLFILGLSASLRALPIHAQVFRLELPVIVLAAGLMMALGWDGVLSQTDGAVMFVVGVIYTVVLVLMTRYESQKVKLEFREEFGAEAIPATQSNWKWQCLNVAVLVIGIGLSVWGADLLVTGASGIARTLGVSETLIGLTIVAIGTSAPELVTTVISTFRNERDVAIGNLLGSSIYNILFILGLTCVAAPAGLHVEPELLWVDIPLMALVTIGAIPVFLTGRSVSRLEGGIAVGIYLAYFFWLIFVRA